MKKSLEQMKKFLESLVWKWRISANTALVNYDTGKCLMLEGEIDTLASLLELVENYPMITLMSWLKCEIVLTQHKEAKYKKRDTYKGYRLAEQQADFRAALQRVESKINLMERQNSGAQRIISTMDNMKDGAR